MTKRSVAVAAIYTAIALAATWPLAKVIDREVAWDMGDPLFNSWVIQWTGGQVLRFLSGDLMALQPFWHGTIFHPAGLTVAYSEHLVPQMLQALPILAATGNVILAYNLLFLSTFVLSAMGTYLLTRALTGSEIAAFLGGLAFAYAPYRAAQFSHLQVLSSFWMPLVLLGFSRFVETRRTKPLVGASAALVLQNLSCGYYLLYFPPFAAAYGVYEMARRGRLREWPLWRALGIAAVAVAVLTWPFVSPYLELRRTRGDVGVRPLQEVVRFSADVQSFATASPGLPALRRFNAYPKQEGDVFPGVTILGFAGLALGWGAARAARRASPARDARWQFHAGVHLSWIAVLALALLLTMLIRGSLPLIERWPWRETGPIFATLTFAVAGLLALVPAARRLVLGRSSTGLGFFLAAAAAAALLSLGPVIESAGQPLGYGPYMWLYEHVPGFDGLRVPARFMMLATLFLSVAVAFGAAALLAANRRLGAVLVSIAAAAVVIEGASAPLRTNMALPAVGFHLAPRRLFIGADAGPLYERVRTDPADVVLIEFPFGEPAYETQAVFYAGYHRRKLVNGYSGFFPEEYLRRATFLDHIPFDLDAATMALRSSGATHALVHEAAFGEGRGHEISDWLRSIGAVELGRYNADRLFRIQ